LNTIQKTLFIGKELHQFDEISSTNAYATQLIAKSKPSDGTVITTYKQLKGKGQGGSYWESEPDKNISMTVILHPRFVAARDQFILNQAVSLGVMDFVKTYISTVVKIKWSNDIYVFDKKIAGILIQNSLVSRNIQNSIIGVGLNINQTVFKSDAPNPSSIFLETQEEVALDVVLQELCKQIEYRYLQLKAGQQEQINEDYQQQLYRLEETHFYRRPTNEVFSGTIKGVTKTGTLIIATDKEEETFALKEIAYVI